jgi:hypothetical protein
MAMLVFSCFVFLFNVVSPFASGASDVIVSNEMELRGAINNAPTKKAFTIALSNDITLTDSTLNIPADKHIVLTSNKAEGYYTITGTAYGTSQFIVGELSVSTITVNGAGVLDLDGISVTHAHNYPGYVVSVVENGQFIMHRGLISSNIGGVHNGGSFLMYGGEISGNSAIHGGGVFNRGMFKLFGGKISGNSVYQNGGGVYNEADGTFEMLGGEISGNTAAGGGGVYNYGGAMGIEYKFTSSDTKEFVGYKDRMGGSFTLSGGIISGNTAWRGGGVNNYGVFIMLDGLISDNTVTGSGGGVNNGETIVVGNFSMSGGEISGNSAEKGGGVYNFFHSLFSLTGNGVISGNTAEMGGGVCMDSDFNMKGGVISGNKASGNGGGVYVGNGVFNVTGGKISENTATDNGGGIWIDMEKLEQLFVSNGATFSNNYASAAYDRDTAHDNVYNSQIGNKVTWSTPFSQGYNNYDISYTKGTPVKPQPSNTPYNPKPSGGNSKEGIWATWPIILVMLCVLIIGIIGVVVAYVVFISKKRKNDVVIKDISA